MNYWFFCFELCFCKSDYDFEYWLNRHLERSIASQMEHIVSLHHIPDNKALMERSMSFVYDRAIRYVMIAESMNVHIIGGKHSHPYTSDNLIITTYAELTAKDAVEYKLRFNNDALDFSKMEMGNKKVLGFSSEPNLPIEML